MKWRKQTCPMSWRTSRRHDKKVAELVHLANSSTWYGPFTIEELEEEMKGWSNVRNN